MEGGTIPEKRGASNSRNKRKPRVKDKPTTNKKKKRWRIFFAIIGVLIVIRLILPIVVLKYVNKALSEMDGYYGHVEDIDLHIYRGAYVIEDLRILKKVEKDLAQDQDTIPFFVTPRIDLSVEWKALFDGSIVGEIEVNNPTLNFVKDVHQNADVQEDTADFKKLIRDLMPLTVNRFDIHQGSVHFIDPTSNPKINLALSNIEMRATNITNSEDASDPLPADLIASANAYGGSFKLDCRFDGLATSPTFDFSAEMRNLNLVELNPFLQAYANFDVKEGNFSLFTEFAAKDGKLGGYVKPVMDKLDVVQWEKEEGNIAQIAYETLISGVAFTLRNKSSGQIATKVPIEGDIDNPDVNVLYSIGYVLRNGFLRALKPALDQTISFNDMKAAKDKTVIETVFGGKKKGKPVQSKK